MIEHSELWYKGVNQAKEKSQKLIGEVIAINLSTSIAVGKLIGAEIDKMTLGQHEACKLTIENTRRYGIKGDFKFTNEDLGIFFANKSEKIMNMEELETKHPKIFEEAHINIKKGVWDGS